MTPRELHLTLEGGQEQQEAEERRTASLMAAIFEQNRNPKNKPEPFCANDFIRKKAEEPTVQDRGSMELSVKLWNAALGGKEVH